MGWERVVHQDLNRLRGGGERMGGERVNKEAGVGDSLRRAEERVGKWGA